MKKSKKQPSLKPRNWLFLEKGTDDFRAGAPKSSSQLSDVKPDIHTHSTPSFLPQPIIFNDDEQQKRAQEIRGRYLGLSTKPKNVSVKLDKHKAVLSSQMPQSEKKRNLIDDVETKLLAHPLALYPHLMKSLPAELIPNVARLLESEIADEDGSVDDGVFDDGNFRTSLYEQMASGEIAADMNKDNLVSRVSRMRKADQKESEKAAENELMAKKRPESRELTKENKLCQNSGNNSSNSQASSSDFIKNIDVSDPLEKIDLLESKKTYTWLIRDEKQKKPTKTIKEMEAEISNQRLQEVAKEFADWSNALSENTANVEPASIIGLFESGYESKPALTVPIQVYELKNLPTELRIADSNENGNCPKQIKKKISPSELAKDGGIEALNKLSSNNLDPDSNLLMDGKSKKSMIDEEEKKKLKQRDTFNHYGKWYIKPERWQYYHNHTLKDKNDLLNGDGVHQSNSNTSVESENEELKNLPSDPNLAAIEKVRIKKERADRKGKESELNKKNQPIEYELANLASAKFFRDYLDKRQEIGKPEFMNTIAKIQDEQVAEDMKGRK